MCILNATTSKRSEEHTSELQSRRHLVCRLLLEKKKSVPVKLGENCRHRPNKHAGIPAKISFANKRFGQVDIWFLAEADDPEETWFAWNWLAHLHVTKTGMS